MARKSTKILRVADTVVPRMERATVPRELIEDIMISAFKPVSFYATMSIYMMPPRQFSLQIASKEPLITLPIDHYNS